MRSHLAADSEGDSDQHAVDVAILSDAVHYTLSTLQYYGYSATISRQDGDCLGWQTLAAPEGVERFPVSDLAADATGLYVVTPGIGIARHAFASDRALVCA